MSDGGQFRERWGGPASTRRVYMMGADCVALPLAVGAATWAIGRPPALGEPAVAMAVLTGAATLLAFSWRGIYRSSPRFVGAHLIVAAGQCLVALAALIAAALALAMPVAEAARAGLVFGALGHAWVMASRFLAGRLMRRGAPPG